MIIFFSRLSRIGRWEVFVPVHFPWQYTHAYAHNPRLGLMFYFFDGKGQDWLSRNVGYMANHSDLFNLILNAIIISI